VNAIYVAASGAELAERDNALVAAARPDWPGGSGGTRRAQRVCWWRSSVRSPDLDHFVFQVVQRPTRRRVFNLSRSAQWPSDDPARPCKTGCG